jgi:hypothetical protein
MIGDRSFAAMHAYRAWKAAEAKQWHPVGVPGSDEADPGATYRRRREAKAQRTQETPLNRKSV